MPGAAIAGVNPTPAETAGMACVAVQGLAHIMLPLNVNKTIVSIS